MSTRLKTWLTPRMLLRVLKRLCLEPGQRLIWPRLADWWRIPCLMKKRTNLAKSKIRVTWLKSMPRYPSSLTSSTSWGLIASNKSTIKMQWNWCDQMCTLKNLCPRYSRPSQQTHSDSKSRTIAACNLRWSCLINRQNWPTISNQWSGQSWFMASWKLVLLRPKR